MKGAIVYAVGLAMYLILPVEPARPPQKLAWTVSIAAIVGCLAQVVYAEANLALSPDGASMGCFSVGKAAAGSGTIAVDLEPGDASASAAIGSETPGFRTEVPGPPPPPSNRIDQTRADRQRDRLDAGADA